MTRVPAAPVREWIQSLELTEREIARRCAARAGTEEGWRKWLTRSASFQQLTLWNVDVLCTVFGAHVSRFDPFYRVAA